MLGIAAIKLWLTLSKGQGQQKVKRGALTLPLSRLIMIVESQNWYQNVGYVKRNALVKSYFGHQVALK